MTRLSLGRFPNEKSTICFARNKFKNSVVVPLRLHIHHIIGVII